MDEYDRRDIVAAISMLEGSIQLSRGAVAQMPDDVERLEALSESLYYLGYVEQGRGSTERAWAFLEEARSLREAIVEERPFDVHSRRRLSNVLSQLGQVHDGP